MRIKLFLMSVLAFTMLSAASYSQDDDLDDLSFEQEPLQEQSDPYFAIAGGYTGTFFFANIDALNALFKDNKFEFGKDMTTPIYLSGAQGITFIPWLPNFRAGFYGYGGSSTVETNLDVGTVDNPINVTRSAEYSVVFTGLSFDYGIVVVKSFTILPGINLGWGNMVIEANQTQGDIKWGEINTAADNLNWLKRAEKDFFYIQPNIYFELALQNFFMLRFNAGYSYALKSDWKFNKSAILNEVPTTLNANGLHLQFGIFIGFFN